MESGKTVQTNLFPGQKQRCRRREMDMWTQKGEGEAGANWEVRTDIHTHHVSDRQWEPTVWHRELSSELCADLDEQHRGRDGREGHGGGDICILIADSFHCTADINTTL